MRLNRVTFEMVGGQVGLNHVRSGGRLVRPSHVRSGGRLVTPSHVRSGGRLVGPNHNRRLMGAMSVLGSIVGVKLIRQTFPKVGYGARLNAGIHHGVLAEGLATFVVVMVSLMLTKKEMKSFFMKTWISSISKMTLHILSSDLTGGIMNPASAFGWAYARGDHITLDHLFVYWLAPIQATLLGIWVANLLNKPKKSKENGTEESKTKSE